MFCLCCSNRLLPDGFFWLILLYFVFGGGWQEPAKLVLRGQAAGSSPIIAVRWNSGAGFNDYEQRQFPLQNGTEDGLIEITIGATGHRWPASQSKDVLCEEVLVDGKPIDLSTIATKPVLVADGLHFKKWQQISFRLRAESSIAFRFRTDIASGIALVSVNGAESEHDLYMANVEAKFKQIDYWLRRPGGAFTIETALPRYPIRELEILNGKPSQAVRLLAVELRSGNHAFDLLQGQPTNLGQVRFHDVLNGMKSWFHPFQFVQQICFALISAWLLAAFLQFAKKLGGLRGCFLNERRYWFWLMLAASLSVFGMWLAAFWPGVMSVDSMKIWRAAMLPDVYLNDHPVVNVFFYKYLRHLWNDPAVIAAAQVFLTSLLVSWFGFWLHRQGVPLAAVLLWLSFLLSSVPVGIYNLMLWKDVPFALLVVFWGCMLVQLRREKQQGRLRWTGQRACALSLLALAAGLVRHNGLIYLIALPAMFLLLGLVPLKKTLSLLAGLLLAAGVAFAVLHSTGKIAATGFFSQELRKYVTRQPIQDIAKNSKRVMQDYMTVLNINQKWQQWDKFHHYFQDRRAWWFLRLSGWWDVYPYQLEKVRFPALHNAALRIYEKSNQEPWIWLAWNPIWLLALLPVLMLLFWLLPNTAVLGVMLLAGAVPLIYLRIFNWRYYYFLYFGLLFLPAFISLDLTSTYLKKMNQDDRRRAKKLSA